MKQIQTSILIFTIFVTMFAGYLFPTIAAAEMDDYWVGKVVSVQGSVQARRAGAAEWVHVRLNDTYGFGDMIRLQELSRAAVVLRNGAIIRLDQKTTITFSASEQEEETFLLDLLHGATHFFSPTPRKLKVTTPFVNAAIGGTEFFVRVEPNQTLLSVFEGRVAAINEAGSLVLASGQSATARTGQAPVSQLVVRPRDAVQWALYYPPVLYYRPADFGSDTGWQAKIRRSIELYWNGDLASAFFSLEGVPENIKDPRFFTYRAGLLLTVGCIDEAGVDIKKALNLDPSNSHAFALKSIIAVVQNQRDPALDLARKAVELAPESPAARVALSYAQQADFNLQGALSSLREAVELGPENALAWSRLSELWLSFGDLDKALEAAKEAVLLNPNIARTQTVLGFAYLTQIKIRDAKNAFEKAIKLDQAAPLPRLGLGLAKIRHGDLKTGREEIEIAASLHPDNSLIRSYLGKAYYEEKRDRLAKNQFAMAKELDPKDPTAWFYGAILKQSQNRPVEALEDLQKSIELNDNRAVYRSRLLLDEDLAARSASLGRIYNDLGFRQLALVEGWKSVNTDPGNYSAHRFLSDSYAVLPRHEVARVSELLQSQLLQPINIAPVQPQLSQSNLFILEGSGPADPSLDEFNPLFYRNRNSLIASGVIGENGILGDELVFSGIQQKVSYSLGQFHYETDGFRENNDLNRDTYNLFLQANLSYKTSILAEWRSTEQDEGDLPLRFPLAGKDNFLPDRRKNRDEKLIRVGLRHAYSPRAQIISHLTRIRAKEAVHDVFGVTPIDASVDDTGYMVEAQHMYQKKYFNLSSGIGYLERDREKTIRFFGENITKPKVSHTNFYLYSQIDYPKNFSWTIGGSADFYDDDETKDRDQFNPKLGLTLTPFAGTTLRAAAFRTLKRSLASRQTIEPTQVAGFNQFFDDLNGAKSWRYGVAIDQTFSSNTHGGLEYSERDIVSPSVDLRTGEIEDADWEESLARAYIYWTPHPFLGLSVEYLFEEFKREDFFTGEEQISKLETHRLPLSVSFFHPYGLSAKVRLSYIDQKGVFGTSPEDFRRDDDQFLLLDTSVRYRLPNRLGFITVGAQNLLDNDFYFQDMDLMNQTIFPERTIFGKLTLSF